MKGKMLALVALMAMATAACGEPSSSPQAEAKKKMDQLTGDDKATSADNPLCKLFTAGELQTYVGEPLGAPQNAAMGSGCQWPTQDDDGDVLIQVVGARYHVPPTGSATYKAIPDLGAQGYVVHYLDGWLAGTIIGEESVLASVAGEKASAEQAVALLRETVKRRAK